MSDQTSYWAGVLERHYGIRAVLEPLVSYEDLNFRGAVETGDDVILKVMHVGCDPALVDVQIAALARIAARDPDLPVPRGRPNLEGAASVACRDQAGVERIVWVISVLPGIPWGSFRPQRRDLMTPLGALIARIDAALAGFDHPALTRITRWDLRQAGWVADEIDVVENARRRAMIERIMVGFKAVEPRLAGQTRTALHNDINDYNILVQATPAGKTSISGIVDFGDIVKAPVICEVAIAGAYMVLGQAHPARALASLVAGVHGHTPLTGEQIDMIWPLLLARLAVSVVTSAINSGERGDEPYQIINQAPAWEFLELARTWDSKLISARLRAACGLPVAGGATAAAAYLAERRGKFGPVVNYDLDPELGSAPGLVLSVRRSAAPRIPFAPAPGEISGIGAAGALGGYGEPRLIDTGPAFRATSNGSGKGNDAGDRRTVHLGVDIIAHPGDSVRAPMAGVVHDISSRYDPSSQDGAVVLAHRGPSGESFFCLYGQLDPASIATLHPAQSVAAGEAFARIGKSDPRGAWTPHLHVQLFLIEAAASGWPAAAEADERAWWLSVCPNPAPLLNLDDAGLAYQPLDSAEILAVRRARTASNLKLSYDEPCLFVRGWRHHLFDEWGREFLDAYNNVPHVGHAHPRIAAVAADQLARLNSNTRYLHPAQTEFAEALVAKLPDHLEVCFFVNSGSEANELALRLARAHTGGRDMIAPDHGYHGHTTGAIDLSAYKFNQSQGGGAPDWVQIVPVADTYRGPYRGPDAGRRYADTLDVAMARIGDRGGRLAGFIAETFPSVGGQIIPPDGYLGAVYDKVRAAGGVTIADEVQTGLGRLGAHYWGFEALAASPDIVVLGKPLGNGHPMGAVVTTGAIADSFDNGIEFFSTFGGSTLSCRTGAEVIRIVDEEGLQANALTVGNHLMGGLKALQDRHEIIGDVRGMGLFVGVDLVEDRAARTPAGAKAAYVKNRLRELRVLVGTEGPHDNVLKIRPPLTIGIADADRLLQRLDQVLEETGFF